MFSMKNPVLFSIIIHYSPHTQNANLGSPVGTVLATDVDEGVNAALTYSFDSFTQGVQVILFIFMNIYLRDSIHLCLKQSGFNPK